MSEGAVSNWKTKLKPKAGMRWMPCQCLARPAKLTDKQQRQLVRILKRGHGRF